MPAEQDKTLFEKIYNAALAEAPDRRASFVQAACEGDETLLHEVESLLGWEAEGLAPGTRLGPYEIVERAGAGGMGEVYKVRDTRLERIVAVKVVSPELAADPGCRARLEREAKAVSALNHPHICTLYDIGRENGIDYIVMEYLDGETLAKAIARGPLPVADAVRYATEIADALSAAHRAGILHRDLKPGNVMLTRSGAKLLDFGLARTIESYGEQQLTATGLLVGSPPYMSPEQVRGEPLDRRTDIFSFGAMLYEMLTGRSPFAADTRAGVVAAILDRDPEPADKVNPAVPHKIATLVRTCLAKDREHRTATIEHALDLLNAVDTRRRSGAIRRTRPRIIAAAAAVAATLLITGLWPVPHLSARITPLTADGLWKFSSLVVVDGRLLYAGASKPGTFFSAGGELWSVPVRGGVPRQEPKPCASTAETPLVISLTYTKRQMLVYCVDSFSSHIGSLFLVDVDGGNPRSLGRFDSNQVFSMSPGGETLLFSRQEGLVARPVSGGPEKLLFKFEWKAPGVVFWHPSGDRIGFAKAAPPYQTLWEVRADGTGPHTLVPGFERENTAAAWSRDGRRLYFISDGDLHVQSDRKWLGWMRKPSAARLTTGAIRFGAPIEDPANPGVLYALGRHPHAELMKLNRRTDVFEPHLGGISADYVNYSRDGEWIAYVRYPQMELWKCRRDGTGRVLLDSGLNYMVPTWSPDSSRIVFSASPPGMIGSQYGVETLVIPADGGPRQRIPGMPANALDGSWSPDGKRLVVGHPPTSRAIKLHVLDLDTGHREEVPGSEGRWSPRWSPKGNLLYASGYEAQHPAVYDFRTKRWVSLPPVKVDYPHWSPDERYIYALTSTPETTLIRIDVAARKVTVLRKITEFTLGGFEPGVFWTPEGEPVALKDLTTRQIYRIDLE